MPGITCMRDSVKAKLKDERENRDNTVINRHFSYMKKTLMHHWLKW